MQSYCNLSLLVEFVQMSNDFEVNQTKVKGGCHSGRKVVPHDSKSDLPLGYCNIIFDSMLA